MDPEAGRVQFPYEIRKGLGEPLLCLKKLKRVRRYVVDHNEEVSGGAVRCLEEKCIWVWKHPVSLQKLQSFFR
jgi:hypothetical protein